MREGWQEVKLGEVCQIRPPKKEAKQKLSGSDMVSFVPMSNLGICRRDIKLTEERPLSKVSGSYTYFAENDVLLAKITPCFENGKLGIARGLTNGIGFGSSEFIVFRTKGAIDPDYLFHFLSQESFRDAGAQVMTGAVGHKRVPKDFIHEHPIPLPPLPEQKRIVAILDKAFAAIDKVKANAEKNLANARELFEEYVNNLYTQGNGDWEEKSIAEIAEVKGGKRVPKGYKLIAGPTQYPYISVTNFTDDGGIDMGSVRYIEEHIYEEIKRHTIAQDDLYISIAGTIGKSGIVPPELDGANLTENACKLVFIQGIYNRFVYYFTKTRSFLDQALLNTRVAAQPKLSLSRLKTIKLIIPSEALQKNIVGKCNELRAQTAQLEAIYQQKLDALAEFKQSILQKAFSGELTADSADLENVA